MSIISLAEPEDRPCEISDCKSIDLKQVAGNLRHLYKQLLDGPRMMEPNSWAKSLARGLLGPQIEQLERHLHPLMEIQVGAPASATGGKSRD